MGKPLVSPGDVLDGKYVVSHLLGEGGMGLVVAASHAILKTQVAIKLLLPGATNDPDTVARFHREARSAVRIHSPYAARVHDVGQLANGTPYMVMDLLAGKDLDALLTERGPLAITEVIGFIMQALQALQEAHSLGIIHRDLKPANLFLADQPSGPPMIKVLDFGIARDFHEGNEQRLTRTRSVMGSPTYMSPEQMREARSADVRSDIWSVGVCLYELLTGRPPFNAATLPDLFVTVLHGVPVPADALRGELPPGLSELILRCLEKDPARRFQNAPELARALAPFASEATWPKGGTTSKTTGASSSPSLPNLDALATGRTVAQAPPATRSRVQNAWIAVSVLGLVGMALAGGALAVRWKRPTLEAAMPREPVQVASEPVPVDLSAASNLAAPETPAAPTPSTSTASNSKVNAAGPSRPIHPATLPSAKLATTPSAVAPAPPPPPPPPTPAPSFDPGRAF